MFDAILKPISEDLPCGEDCKYEDSFLELEQEVDKDASASEDLSTDWSSVVSSCEALLSEQTKDLKLMSWLIFGQYHQNGIGSFLESLDALRELIQTYKKDVFPKSPRGKNNVLTSLDTFLSAILLDDKQTLEHFQEQEKLLEVFDALAEAIKADLESEENFFNKIRETIRRTLKDQKKRAEQQEKAAVAKSESGQIDTDTDANKVLNGMKKDIQNLNAYWNSKDPSDMRALKMTRLISWLDIDALPESDGGKIGMNGPSFDGMEAIESLEASGKFAEALQMCEGLMNYAPFWIDGHIKSFELLKAMDADESARYVLQTLISFVQTHKGMLDLSYADGTPFASLASKAIINEAMPSGGGASSNEENPLVLAKDAAQGFLKKKKMKEGLQHIEDAYNSSKNEEERFEMRLLHAELALDSGQQDAAQALLDDLVEKIEQFRIDQWKPELAAKAYGMYLSHFNRTQIDHESYESMYKKLCKIDIAKALSIH